MKAPNSLTPSNSINILAALALSAGVACGAEQAAQ